MPALRAVAKRGCIVANFHARDGWGAELLDRLLSERVELPVVFVFESKPTITQIVKAFRHGACDVLDLGSENKRLAMLVRTVVKHDQERRLRRLRKARALRKIRMLTDGEKDVLRLVLQQFSNVAAASRLGVSVRTVERRRNSIYSKLSVESLVELWTLADDAGYRPQPHFLDSQPTSADANSDGKQPENRRQSG